ncbi:hypothetical protein D3C76_1401800 [compost metagenome]
MRIAGGPGDAAHEHVARRRLAQLRQFVAELGQVEQFRVQGAAAGQRAGQVLVVVGIFLGHRIAHPRVLLEVADHLRRVFEVGLQPALVDAAFHRCVQVAERLVEAVLAALGLEMVVVGNPDAAAG